MKLSAKKLQIIHSFFSPFLRANPKRRRNNEGAAKVAGFANRVDHLVVDTNRVMKMFESKEFDQAPAVQEAPPSDVTYNFGGSAATGVTVKIATYLASAFVLGGSIFATNQILSPANLQSADKANAAGQSQDAQSLGDDSSIGEDSSAAQAAATAEATAAAAAEGSEDSASATSFSASSHSGARTAAKKSSSTSTIEATPTTDPSPTADPVVVDPTPPSFSHGNTSSATPTAGNTSNGSGSNFGEDDEDEGDDD